MFLAIGVDIAGVAIVQLPAVSQQAGFTFWNVLLTPLGLSQSSPVVLHALVALSIALQWIAFVMALDAFFDAGKAAEELRYLQRSGTDRELIKQLDAPHSPRLTSATPTADDALKGR